MKRLLASLLALVLCLTSFVAAGEGTDGVTGITGTYETQGRQLMGLFSGLFGKKKQAQPYYYSEADLDAFEKMVTGSIGKFDTVFHEIVSPDIHVDIVIIPPTPEKDYYILLTMGMGAYPMKVPLEYKNRNRAELAIRLPKDWDISSEDEKWSWPIWMLKTLARLPINENSWLGRGHDIDFGKPFSEETELCAILLDFFDENLAPLTLENGDQVMIYNVIPIYREEMDYKVTHDTEALTSKMSNETLHGPLDVHRDKAV